MIHGEEHGELVEFWYFSSVTHEGRHGMAMMRKMEVVAVRLIGTCAWRNAHGTADRLYRHNLGDTAAPVHWLR